MKRKKTIPEPKYSMGDTIYFKADSEIVEGVINSDPRLEQLYPEGRTWVYDVIDDGGDQNAILETQLRDTAEEAKNAPDICD